MRRARWLILVAILVIAGAVFRTYTARIERIRKEAPAPAKPLEDNVDARSRDWVYVKTDSARGRDVVEVRAKNVRMIKEPSLTELEDVRLKLYHKDGKVYDYVTCARAMFDTAAKALVSEGEVQIAMGVDSSGSPKGRLVKIRAAGVRFESETGKTSTDREAFFEFDQGGGSAKGADYDPQTRELHLHSDVKVHWRGSKPGSKQMNVEAGEAYYKENESKVLFLPWSKLRRDTLYMEGGMSVVTLEDGSIKLAEVQNGKGANEQPGRKITFGAEMLNIHFGEETRINKIHGEREARLRSEAPAGATSVASHSVELMFEPAGDEITLNRALANGQSSVESKPVIRPGVPAPDTRILRSETIVLNMKPGGKDIANVETATPASIEFLPNRTGQPKREMQAERVHIAYGEHNQVESMRATTVSTRTERPNQPPALTSSKELAAKFDPETSSLIELEQWQDFRYEEGSRRARGDRAKLEQAKELMTLQGSARVWDPTGSTSADRITMDQKSGDFTARGRVNSVRQPDKKGNSSAMLSKEDPIQATADTMVSTDRQQKIRYSGSAVAWQGANRVQADQLLIDRPGDLLEAAGNVVSQFVDKPKKPDAKAKSKAKAGPPVFTIVRSPHLLYTGKDRVANYNGGVSLTRPGLQVNSRDLRAFLKDASEDSSLDRAVATGAVEIVQNDAKRARNGTGEIAEYFSAEEKVVLKGGQPKLVDRPINAASGSTTTGQQLTWWANDDRLLVEGAPGQPTHSTIRRKN